MSGLESNTQWEEGKKGKEELTKKVDANGLAGLTGLFSMSSMTSDSRNMREHMEAFKALTEKYESLKKSTTNDSQRAIIPSLTTLTQNISPSLPGIGLHKVINNVVYVMVALFSNRDVATGTERVAVNNNLGHQQSISIPLTPVAYLDRSLRDSVTAHYASVGEQQNARQVKIISLTVVDLEMYKHSEIGETQDLPQVIAEWIASEWEEGIYVRTTEEISALGKGAPASWATPSAPYGKDSQAEARVNAIPGGRVNRGKQLTSSNLEVITNTVNNQGSVNSNSKEVCRVAATVSLQAVSYENYQQRLAAGASNADLMRQLMMQITGGSGGSNCWTQNYKPLAATINIDSVKAGEALRFHDGLYPFFYGLYTAMVTNQNYAWADSLRRAVQPGRSSLADIEPRIQQMIAGSNGAALVNEKNRIVLTNKNVSDIDLVNQWFQQNCSPNLKFTVRIGVGGVYCALNNFLQRLAIKDKNSAEKRTVIDIIDAQTGNKFSEIIAENVANKTGWTPSEEILIPTPQLSINGIAAYSGRQLNLSEIDEMTLCHIKGNGAQGGIDNYLRQQYGLNPQEGIKQRQQGLRTELTQSMYGAGEAHINSFDVVHIFHPQFLATMGKAFDSIGTMTIANSFGSWRTVPASWSIGAGLELTTSVGTSANAVTGFAGW